MTASGAKGIEERISREAAELEQRGAPIHAGRASSAPTSAEDVIRLRGSFRVEHSVARAGAERLWELVNETEYVNALGPSPAARPSRW